MRSTAANAHAPASAAARSASAACDPTPSAAASLTTRNVAVAASTERPRFPALYAMRTYERRSQCAASSGPTSSATTRGPSHAPRPSNAVTAARSTAASAVAACSLGKNTLRLMQSAAIDARSSTGPGAGSEAPPVSRTTPNTRARTRTAPDTNRTAKGSRADTPSGATTPGRFTVGRPSTLTRSRASVRPPGPAKRAGDVADQTGNLSRHRWAVPGERRSGGRRVTPVRVRAGERTPVSSSRPTCEGS